jgi:hypothetical protein
MSEATTTTDSQLQTRLRDLSIVDLDALLAGTSGQRYAELLVTYGDDLEDAVRVARRRMGELLAEVSAGPDPLGLVDMASDMRARDGGRELAERVVTRLAARAKACRALARLDDLVSDLLERLFEADRRRASLAPGG